MTEAFQCSSTMRMIADAQTSAADGRIEWAPAKSLWTGGMLAAALLLGPVFITPGAVALFVVTTIVTLCAGHSVGMHRLLVHRSFSARPWVEYVLVYLGTLVGMAGPVGMVRLHDMRDWAQRQPACHALHANRLPLLRDALLQTHARLVLANPPRFVLEPRIAADKFFRWLEATWMLQQLPWVALFYAGGGMPWLIWGVPVRIAVSLTGHWLVVHLTHRDGPQGWTVDGESVQGHDLPAAAWLTFGEAWHSTHHAWPDSARLGIEPGQADPGWWLLCGLERLGLVWNMNQPETLQPRPGVRQLQQSAHKADPPSAPGRLTVWYNTRCPVCDAGIGWQRNRLIKAARAGAIEFRDINQEPDALAHFGAGIEDVRRRLHGVDAIGRLHVGADCAVEIWRRTPGDGWLASLLGAPGVRWPIRLGYDLFSKILYAWNRRMRHW